MFHIGICMFCDISQVLYIHANYLIMIPDNKIRTKYVELVVIRGGDFWSLGLRALYFAINLLLWFFWPNSHVCYLGGYGGAPLLP
ncbi:hypothetical protein RHGRI_004715 [Rhododendron griersonianum]|uniref:Uncharacterized protein n=1 Tax=Rhododendron griersonianum TaxID=479676 RepID=A0AAV6LAL3_9ERIC|nr:hypothetical protein RHGRI_004715 [Rhododendron griersonianum]